MDIIESNKLIAEFMGLHKFGNKKTSDTYHHDLPDYRFLDKKLVNPAHHYTPKQMKYHTSWDWLMPVVDRIETFNFKVDGVTTSADVHIVYGDCRIVDEDGGGLFEFCSHSTDSGDKLQATYDSVVKFIEWYNLVRKINQR